MNYPEPFELHDYQYLGKNFRERERIHRQQRRWAARLARMSALQRFALLDAISQVRTGTTDEGGNPIDRTSPEPASVDRV